MKPKRFVFQSQMFGFARCDFLLVTASLLGCLVTFGLQKQVFAQDKVEAPNVISQSDLIGSQLLETPYGVMTIENAYPTEETVSKLFAQRDRQRATELYLWSLPIV